MDRIVVVGPPGSGKTTTAAAIAKRLGASHTELDSLWWDPNWTEVGPDEFRARLAFREHPKYNRKYDALARSGEHPTWVRLQTPRAVRQWVASLPAR